MIEFLLALIVLLCGGIGFFVKRILDDFDHFKEYSERRLDNFVDILNEMKVDFVERINKISGIDQVARNKLSDLETSLLIDKEKFESKIFKLKKEISDMIEEERAERTELSGLIDSYRIAKQRSKK